MTVRRTIYEVIDEERGYQDEKWGSIEDYETDMAAWVVHIERHLEKAKAAVYERKDKEVLSEIRKIAALGVAAMEEHGFVRRNEE